MKKVIIAAIAALFAFAVHAAQTAPSAASDQQAAATDKAAAGKAQDQKDAQQQAEKKN